jgi:hypothetical protein
MKTVERARFFRATMRCMNTWVRTAWRRWFWAISVGLIAAAAAAQSLEVIRLQHRAAEEILPAIQPLVATGGAVSGRDYTLFVRTTPANLADIRKVVAQLDRTPRQLLISVRTATRQEIERASVSMAGQLSTAGASASVSGQDAAAHVDASGATSVAVLEGNAAMIDNGSSVPIVTAVAGDAGRRPWAAAEIEYRALPNGFVVVPRVNGETVVLDIEQRSDVMRNGRIDTQQIRTQVSGRVGAWIPLGGVAATSTTTAKGIGSRSYSTHTDERSLWVKVETR